MGSSPPKPNTAAVGLSVANSSLLPDESVTYMYAVIGQPSHHPSVLVRPFDIKGRLYEPFHRTDGGRGQVDVKSRVLTLLDVCLQHDKHRTVLLFVHLLGFHHIV